LRFERQDGAKREAQSGSFESSPTGFNADHVNQLVERTAQLPIFTKMNPKVEKLVSRG
jgi:hypothetical protein